MEIIKEADFRREIKTAPKTAYLFFGEEDYLKQHALAAARAAICPEETFAVFNDLRLDALDFRIEQLRDALMPLPMMAERKLVTLTGLNLNTMRQGELDELLDTVSLLSEYDYNVLILSVASDALDPGTLPKRPSGLLKQLSEYLTPVAFDRCSPQKLVAWVERHFTHHGITATAQFCSEVIEYCGRSMFLLANEIEKLSYYLLSQERTEPTRADLQAVCVSSTEYDVFALTNAIMNRNREAALAILADYRFRRVDPLIIMGEVSRVFYEMIQVQAMTKEGITASVISSTTKIHEYRVGLYQKSFRQSGEERPLRALEACVVADSAIKNSSQGYAALERLICTV